MGNGVVLMKIQDSVLCPQWTRRAKLVVKRAQWNVEAGSNAEKLGTESEVAMMMKIGSVVEVEHYTTIKA
jgi:hypothetical protein